MDGDATKPKLERRNLFESPETVIMKKQRRGKTDFQQSNAASSARTVVTPEASGRTVRVSPLELFRGAKNELSRVFFHAKNGLVESRAFLKETGDKGTEKKMESLVEKTERIKEIVDRAHMKVVFFGLNSSGKSTVVNALLRNNIFPMSLGHTTSCFCSIKGVASSEGYVLVPGSEEKKSVKFVHKLASAFNEKDRLPESSLLEVYWPKSKCALLQEDVELVDSPAFQLRHSLDEWINQYCQDADVFVLVAKANAPLTKAQASFFVRVSERLSVPNIFILVNQWDLYAKKPKTAEDLKKQHLDSFAEFFSGDLKLSKKEAAAKRVYFVSAKEVLAQRIRHQNQVKDVYQGFAEGHRQRLVEFERFEEQLKESLSSSAIHTKFENHHRCLVDIFVEQDELIREKEHEIINRIKCVCCDLEEAERYKQRLMNERSSLQNRCEAKVSKTVENVKEEFSRSIGNVIRQFADIASDYNAEFDLRHLESYKAGLFEHVDSSLQQMLQELGSSTLHSLHDEACADITSCYQRVLEASLAETQQLSSQARAPEITYVLCCADLCKDFKEDLEFHFSLGVHHMAKWIHSGAVLFHVQQQLSNMSAIIPPNLIVPLSIILGTVVVSRLLSWRYLLPGVGIYFGMYAYQKFTWTERSQERALKSQFVAHLESKFQLQVRAIQANYTASFHDGLKDLSDSLNDVFHDAQTKQDLKIKQLRKEVDQQTSLKQKAHALRNNSRLLNFDLKTFKQDYLNGVE